MRTIDFWFSIGSTYTYLSVMRLSEVAERAKVAFRWRPFDVRSVMVAQNNIPFRGKPVKTAYMWRDIARRAEKYGLPARLPAPYPLEHLERANRVALLGLREDWGEKYVVESYRRWFQMGEPAGSEPNLSKSIAWAGGDPDRARVVAETAEIASALAGVTDTAQALGVFGSPSFVVDGEVFWGDDRLEDAVSWARSGRVAG